MSNPKWYSIAATVTLEQKQVIEKKASDSGMSVNEYIKARLFIDDESEEVNKINNLDKWMIKVMAHIASTVGEIAKKTLSSEEIKNLEPTIGAVANPHPQLTNLPLNFS